MANVNVNWVLPTTRASGKPLDPADIASVDIGISIDGTTFSAFGSYPPTVLGTVLTELEAGKWFVSGVVKDSKGRVSQPIVSSIVIEDNTPPSALKSLTLTLA